MTEYCNCGIEPPHSESEHASLVKFDPLSKDSLRTAQLEVMAVLRRRWRRDSRGLDTALRKWVKKLGRTT